MGRERGGHATGPARRGTHATDSGGSPGSWGSTTGPVSRPRPRRQARLGFVSMISTIMAVKITQILHECTKGAKMMRTKRGMRFMTVAGFVAVLGLASGARAQQEIPLKRVPRAVMNSAKAKFPGAKIKVASAETEDGKPPVFVLEMTHHRQSVDATFKVDGTVVLVETDVPAKELPKVVLRALEDEYPGATVRGRESVKKGPEVKKVADYYQFYLLTADEKPALVKVDPHGRALEPEVKTALKKRDKKGMKKG